MSRVFDIVAASPDDPGTAKTVSVVITDDLDGSPSAQAVASSFDGHSYEIDLGKKNRAKFQKSLQPFVDAGRRVTQRRTASFPGIPARRGRAGGASLVCGLRAERGEGVR
jgi:hypothetical protein